MSNESQLLKIKIIDGLLTMSIGVDALKVSIESGRADMFCDGEFFITDKDAFYHALISELKSEEEDGSTLLHLMLDAAALKAYGNGAQGCDVK